MIEVENGHRLVIPVPEGGWLTAMDPKGRDDRRIQAERWRARTRKSLEAAAEFPTGLGPVCLLVVIRLAEHRQQRIRHTEDVRPTVVAVKQALVAAGVIGPGRAGLPVEEMRFGAVDDLGGQLVMHLVEDGCG